MSSITVTAKRRPTGRDPNALYLEINGKEFGGWQQVRVTRGVERMPSDFEVILTERYPGEIAEVLVQPGQTCIVRIGDDRVITGYIDRYTPSLSAGAHSVAVSGRGKCQDLVDCSAVVTGSQIGGAPVVDLVGTLASPFGITVSATVSTGNVPQTSVNLGETPWDIIDRISRWAQLLCYEDTFGNLVLSQVGTVSAASGIVQGQNVEAASITYSMDQRFSVYTACLMSVDTFAQIGPGGNVVATVKDTTVPRYRPKVIISEQTVNGQDIAVQRLNWELARRIGRSQAVSVTIDSWRDSAGVLWEPNTLVAIDLPALKLTGVSWVIGEVTYQRGESGTHADLLLMPAAAFQPEPNVLTAFYWQVDQALPAGSAGKAS